MGAGSYAMLRRSFCAYPAGQKATRPLSAPSLDACASRARGRPFDSSSEPPYAHAMAKTDASSSARSRVINRLQTGGPLTKEATAANERLRLSLDRVLRAGSASLRRQALAEHRRAVEKEEGRVRREDHGWAWKVAREEWKVVQAACGVAEALKVALESLAVSIADVSDPRFMRFRAGEDDVRRVRAALRKGGGATWLLAFLAERTGALGDDAPRASPSDVQLERRTNRLKQTRRRS